MRLVIGARSEIRRTMSGWEAAEESEGWLLTNNSQKNKMACVETKVRNYCSTRKENHLKQAMKLAWLSHHFSLKGLVGAASASVMVAFVQPPLKDAIGCTQYLAM